MPALGLLRGWRAKGMIVVLCLLLIVGMRHFQQVSLRNAVMRADPEEILRDPRLGTWAVDVGRQVFLGHCASCHGADGHGSRIYGVPDLTGRERLYGEGQISVIESIALYGIRAGDTRGWDLASMPAYGTPTPYSRYAVAPLTPGEIADVAAYVRSFSATDQDSATVARGAMVFDAAGCWDCHAHDAHGDSAIGAPNLTDNVWLYGDGSVEDIARSVAWGRRGESPAFAKRLQAWQARTVSVYIASLAVMPRAVMPRAGPVVARQASSAAQQCR